MKTFRIIGVVLIFANLGWTLIIIQQHQANYLRLQLLDIGIGFEGALQISKEEIHQAYSKAQHLIDGRVRRANGFRLAGDICSLLSFLASAILTLRVATLGKVSAPGVDPNQLLAQLFDQPRRRLRWLAVLAAFSAVLTAAANQSLSQGAAAREQARHLHQRASEARGAILKATTPEEATAALGVLHAVSLE